MRLLKTAKTTTQRSEDSPGASEAELSQVDAMLSALGGLTEPIYLSQHKEAWPTPWARTRSAVWEVA